MFSGAPDILGPQQAAVKGLQAQGLLLEQLFVPLCGLGHLGNSDRSQLYCLKTKFGQSWAFSTLPALIFWVG